MRVEQSEIKVFLDAADLQAMYNAALILDGIFNSMTLDTSSINGYSREDIHKAKSVITSLYFSAKQDDEHKVTISCGSSCPNDNEDEEDLPFSNTFF